MARKKKIFKNVRLVYRSSPLLVKCVVLAAIVLSTAALIVLRGEIQETRNEQKALQLQAIQLEQENRALTEQIAELGTMESIKRIASLKLGLVDPDSQFFYPSSDTIPD